MSGKKKAWEFDCPQFVDFASGLDEYSSPSNDVWLGEQDGHNTKLTLKLMNEAFGPKMATPKLKPFKSLKNSPYVNTERPIKTDDEKLEMLGKLPLRESKSDGFLNRIDKKLKSPYQLPSVIGGPEHRRSLSDCCIKTKKKLCPSTPMCMKRVYNKGKKKLKTTEELEMEQITKLQNELHAHLRLNEINLKRIKENRVPFVTYNKMWDKKSKTKAIASNDYTIKGFEAAGGRLNDLRKRIGQSGLQGRKMVSKEDSVQNFKRKAEELQAILNPESKSTTRLNALRDINIVENGKNLKVVLLSKYNAHSGVKFHPNEDKKTIPHPFSFDTSSTSFQNLSFSFKENDKISASMSTPQLLINKENIHPTNRLHSESKREKNVIRRNF